MLDLTDALFIYNIPNMNLNQHLRFIGHQRLHVELMNGLYHFASKRRGGTESCPQGETYFNCKYSNHSGDMEEHFNSSLEDI